MTKAQISADQTWFSEARLGQFIHWDTYSEIWRGEQFFRADGLKVGLYLAPWDRHEKCCGDSPRYNDFYCAQLTELLTNYGELLEVWFDRACAEGPNGRKQEYDWEWFFGLVKTLRPGA